MADAFKQMGPASLHVFQGLEIVNVGQVSKLFADVSLMTLLQCS